MASGWMTGEKGRVPVLKILTILIPCVLSLIPWGTFLRSASGADSTIVSRIVDGDTLAILLNGQTEKVRLIGVDTPELHESDKLHRDAQRSGQDIAQIQALGRQASDFVKTLVRSGDQISLEYDQQPRDKYGRLLAFVWLADGRMLNEVIICEGYAPALTRYPFRRDYQERFRTCAQTARAAGKGLWATEPTAVASPSPVPRAEAGVAEVRGNRRTQVYHLPNCPAYDTLSTKNIVPFTSEDEARRAGYRKAGNCP
jgi:micrococcal nuclease